jgi:osmotically-inducible protein OsmY
MGKLECNAALAQTTRLRQAALVIVCALTISSSLTACLPLAAAGVAAGAMATLDRRSFGAQTEDQAIELKAASRLAESVNKTASVSVTSYNRKVLLTGQVPDEKSKAEAEAVVGKIENVLNIHNELTIGIRAALGVTTGDSATTTRVRASLVEARDLQSNAYKVVTESGTCYLMGMVSRREGDRAAQMASRVGGVRRVVTVFEYLSDDELARIQRRGSDKN